MKIGMVIAGRCKVFSSSVGLLAHTPDVCVAMPTSSTASLLRIDHYVTSANANIGPMKTLVQDSLLSALAITSEGSPLCTTGYAATTATTEKLIRVTGKLGKVEVI